MPDAGPNYLIYKASDGIDNSEFGVITFTTSARESEKSRDLPPRALDDNISMQEDGVKIVEFWGFDPLYNFNKDATIKIISGPFKGSLEPVEPEFIPYCDDDPSNDCSDNK